MKNPLQIAKMIRANVISYDEAKTLCTAGQWWEVISWLNKL